MVQKALVPDSWFTTGAAQGALQQIRNIPLQTLVGWVDLSEANFLQAVKRQCIQPQGFWVADSPVLDAFCEVIEVPRTEWKSRKGE